MTSFRGQAYVLDLQQLDETQVAVVGGKGAHLGELSRIEGIRVPAGFCVTTDAFRRIMAEAPSIVPGAPRRRADEPSG
jgi:pyruvate,water dikinase